MNEKQACIALHKVNLLAEEAKNNGKHPFAAILLGADAETVLLSAYNVSTVRHAEIEVVRMAEVKYDSDFLWHCTLVTNFEPCAMCTGAIYWANIGRIVYGAPETELIKLTGTHKENPTLKMPCREIIKAGAKQIIVQGPYASIQEEILELHRNFWV